MNHDFILVNCDTDSVMFSKPDGSPFSEQEQEDLLIEINSLLPEKIQMAHDGIFPRVLIIKSKNYILDNGKYVKFKGSSVADSKKEPIILELIHKIGHILLDDKKELLLPLYNEYILKSQNIQDIVPWCTKKTITKSVLNPVRTNEQKVLDALNGKEVSEGDKIYVFYDSENNLQLVENWQQGTESKVRLLKRIWDSFNIFKTVLDVSQFPKYHNKTMLSKLVDLDKK